MDSFITTNRFFDNKHYPRGFSRHGDFTIKEAQILERYGYAFNELALSKREPITDEERSFIEVCRGLREPQTEAERVWMKYITRINHPRRFHTLSGGKPNTDSIEDFNDTYD
ncbi:DUF413 domain-containing protein [Pantoea sp. Aalb]|uniref:DUF413 domain-containing protein n=1 Tax=Pantoea sp. Aalb TaxID=2576762 RepID=UPI001323745C|nr:DUF413 domain-containing protein [Pantoea sp. Aalb]MXP67140.1 DUF413 domain-containing protein [Pantoea sp. Aalb]